MIQSSDVISAASQNTQGHREKARKKELVMTGVQELNLSEKLSREQKITRQIPFPVLLGLICLFLGSHLNKCVVSSGLIFIPEFI